MRCFCLGRGQQLDAISHIMQASSFEEGFLTALDRIADGLQSIATAIRTTPRQTPGQPSETATDNAASAREPGLSDTGVPL